jgi:hypothetical protein
MAFSIAEFGTPAVVLPVKGIDEVMDRVRKAIRVTCIDVHAAIVGAVRHGGLGGSA